MTLCRPVSTDPHGVQDVLASALGDVSKPIATSRAALVMRKAAASVIMMRISREWMSLSGVIMESATVNLNAGIFKNCGRFVGGHGRL